MGGISPLIVYHVTTSVRNRVNSIMVKGTLLNFGKRYKDDLRVIFDQWQKLHFGLDALSNQKILNSN